MSPEEFTALVGKVTYRPGVRLTTYENFGTMHLRITAKVPCAVARDGSELSVQMMNSIAVGHVEYFDRAAALNFLFKFLLKFEEHEAGEWFRVGNEAPFWPHKDEKY